MVFNPIFTQLSSNLYQVEFKLESISEVKRSEFF